MKILNLVNPEKGDISYERITFSDSQTLINIKEAYDFSQEVTIKSRMAWSNLQEIVCATESLRRIGFERIHLYVPYFLGARSDREFHYGSVNYIRDVIAPIINALNFRTVTVIDPHSNCLETGIKRFRRDDSSWRKLLLMALRTVETTKGVVVVGPDKGSEARATEAARVLSTTDLLLCNKHRDISTGKITGIDVGNLTSFKGKAVFVVDDICDGGATFIELAKKLRLYEPGSMNLIVTHGIFSKGFSSLYQFYDEVYCTNSVKDINLGMYVADRMKNFVKQLEVL